MPRHVTLALARRGGRSRGLRRCLVLSLSRAAIGQIVLIVASRRRSTSHFCPLGQPLDPNVPPRGSVRRLAPERSAACVGNGVAANSAVTGHRMEPVPARTASATGSPDARWQLCAAGGNAEPAQARRWVWRSRIADQPSTRGKRDWRELSVGRFVATSGGKDGRSPPPGTRTQRLPARVRAGGVDDTRPRAANGKIRALTYSCMVKI
jgi:hypothetical protein